jgi:hypothetical protein
VIASDSDTCLEKRRFPYSVGGAYVNFMMDEGEERVKASYRDSYVRLAAIKRTYGPSNFFRAKQNIKPTSHLVGNHGRGKPCHSHDTITSACEAVSWGGTPCVAREPGGSQLCGSTGVMPDYTLSFFRQQSRVRPEHPWRFYGDILNSVLPEHTKTGSVNR